MIYVRLHSRQGRDGNFSIEGVFRTIQIMLQEKVRFLTNDVQENDIISSTTSSEQIIHHITGDVHYIALKLPARQTILTVHDIGHYERTLKGVKKWIYKWIWLRLPFQRVKYITCVSEFTKQRILKHFNISPEKIKVIYNPVPEGFSFSEWPDNPVPVLLQVGTRPHKNLETVIKGVAGMKVKLFIVGPLSEQQECILKQAAIDYSNFRNVSDDDMVRLYHQANVVTFISLHEGFGLPIIESQACGRPVIISGCTSLPEIAGPGACILTDPYDHTSLKDQLNNILENKQYRNEVIRNGLNNIKRFTPEAIAGQYLSLYNSMQIPVFGK